MTRTLIIFCVTVLAIGACTQGPRHVEIGVEECAHCRMIVSEERFFAQLRTDQGRSYVFDSIECMAEFVLAGDDAARTLWVADFGAPDSWIPVESAYFLQSEAFRSPMGMNLSAYGNDTEVQAHHAKYGGRVMDWTGVLDVVESRGLTQTDQDHAQ